MGFAEKRKSKETKPHQSNALHPNELGLGLHKLGLGLGGAKSRNMAKTDVSLGNKPFLGDILGSGVEYEFWSSVGTLEDCVGSLPDVSYYSR